MTLACLALLSPTQDGPDPLVLNVLGEGTLQVSEGLWRTGNGRKVTLQDVVDAAKGVRFVFVGESHDQAPHHAFQAQVVQALVDSGRNVVVGFEMFTRDNQKSLNPWTLGFWDREEFIANAQWKTQWGFDYALYEPVFETVKKNRLPMYALNAPRDWIRQIGRQGAESVTEEQRKWIPPLFVDDQPHKAIFQAMTGGHPMTGPQAANMYAAMVAWDEAMANSALDAMDGRLDRSAVMVVVAGSGHMMYDRGINYRIKRRTGEKSLNVICVTSEGPRQVSRSLADFVLVSGPKPAPKG